MFDKAGPIRHTNEFDVSLTLQGQDAYHASVFLKLGERLIDLLNDARAFIPVRGPDGVRMIAKSSIISILEKTPEEKKEKEKSESGANSNNDAKRHFDPYKALRVDPSASTQEIKRAYKERIKAVHPDTIAALDLDEDLTRAAILAAQKVNHAYKIIMKERDAEAYKHASG